jgi:hypothetical protein
MGKLSFWLVFEAGQTMPVSHHRPPDPQPYQMVQRTGAAG